jgi:hypothetical protein
MKATLAGIACIASLAAFDATADISLAHRYSFNDGTAKDSVGKAHGTAVGGVRIEGGQARFDGKAGQRVELQASGTDGITINGFKAVTLEAWYTVEQAKNWQRVFDFGASPGLDTMNSFGANCLHYIATSGHQDARAVLSNMTPSFKSEAVAKTDLAPLNKEVHVAVVVDASTITLFIDGEQKAQSPLEGRTLAKLASDFAVLGDSMYANDPSLTGSINEFRIYDGAATAAKVAASFKAGPDAVLK